MMHPPGYRKEKYSISFWSFSLLSLVIVLLTSACSLSGPSDNSSNTPSMSSVVPTTTPHSVAKQPVSTGGQNGNEKPLPANEVKPLTFNLVYNDAAFEQDMAQIYTLGSPSYHKFLSSDQIVQKYALSDGQMKQVQDWLTQQGFTITSTDALHSAIRVQGTVATIEKSLNIKLQALLNSGRKDEVFVHHGDPKLPSSIAGYVQSIVGLNNIALPEFKPPFSIAQGATLEQKANANCAGYGAKQTLTRDKLAAAYQINSLYKQGFQGQGMTIGVAEFGEPYNPADIANYAACVGLPTPTIENIDVDGHLASGSGEGEAALDLELIAGLAPKATILDYQADTTSTSFAQALVDVFNRVATDHRVQVLSVSYGSAESDFSSTDMSAVNRSLRTLAAEGISVLISSGDCGAYTRRLHKIADVAFPASAPYAITIGGTRLEVNDSNVRTSETAWGGDDNIPVCQNSWGSGGGVSQNADFQRPSWQVGQGTTTHYDGAIDHVLTAGFPPTPVSAPNGLRQVPDFAAAAYPNIAIYYKGNWLASGGTSAAAPIIAAGLALVDQGLMQHGKALQGGVPGFYTMANHPGSHHPYTDIVEGSNLFYSSTVGWDYVTGWGSPNFSDMLQLSLEA